MTDPDYNNFVKNPVYQLNSSSSDPLVYRLKLRSKTMSVSTLDKKIKLYPFELNQLDKVIEIINSNDILLIHLLNSKKLLHYIPIIMLVEKIDLVLDVILKREFEKQPELVFREDGITTMIINYLTYSDKKIFSKIFASLLSNINIQPKNKQIDFLFDILNAHVDKFPNIYVIWRIYRQSLMNGYSWKYCYSYFFLRFITPFIVNDLTNITLANKFQKLINNIIDGKNLNENQKILAEKIDKFFWAMISKGNQGKIILENPEKITDEMIFAFTTNINNLKIDFLNSKDKESLIKLCTDIGLIFYNYNK